MSINIEIENAISNLKAAFVKQLLKGNFDIVDFNYDELIINIGGYIYELTKLRGFDVWTINHCEDESDLLEFGSFSSGDFKTILSHVKTKIGEHLTSNTTSTVCDSKFKREILIGYQKSLERHINGQ